jgi:hypothetical protein
MYYFPSRNDMVRAILKPGWKLAEIGVFRGEFAQVLAGTRPDLLVLIDPWEGILTSGDCDGNNVVQVVGEEVFKSLSETTKGVPCIKIRRGKSEDVMKEFPDNFLDFVYIDGLHTFEGCYSDLELAYKKVKPGGWICFHDFGLNYLKCKHAYAFGVVQAVETFCIKYNQKIIALGLDGCVSGAIQLQKPSSS